jgi:MFS-type transporter involved in bile tolerance (Atg22 family)
VITVCIVVLILVCLVIVGMTRESVWGIPLDPASALPDQIFFVCGALIGAAGGALQAASRTMMAGTPRRTARPRPSGFTPCPARLRASWPRP